MTLLTLSLCLWTGLLAGMWLDKRRSDRTWRRIWRKLGMPIREDQMETALRDFVIAYDDQVPEQLLAAYDQAADCLR